MEEQQEKNKKRMLTGILFILIAVFLLWNYWFVPFNEFSLSKTKKTSSEFLTENITESKMQFYDNMRFPNKEISYKIDRCPLQKEDEMEHAFKIIENLTVLEFYPVAKNEEITVTCGQKVKIEEDFFIAGEGGPTDITKSGQLKVITHGRILLLRESQCPDPVIPIHELLHVLGFVHSPNPKNIMHNFSSNDCDQEIGEEIPKLLNNLYSIPSRPDLVIIEAIPKIDGRYLNANITIRNQGLKESPKSKIVIYEDEKKLYDAEIEKLEIGYGTKIMLKNIKLERFSFKEIIFNIESNSTELETSNNKIIFEKK